MTFNIYLISHIIAIL